MTNRSENVNLVFLASTSPRRAELLSQLNIAFDVVRIDIPEIRENSESPEVFAIRLALEKAKAGLESIDNEGQFVVIGSDTCVVVDDRVLGKPQNRSEAISMLKQLSGREHRVLTSVAVIDKEHELTRLSVNHVCFRDISEDEMASYWATGEPAGKAGSYAIQGCAAQFVKRLEGSYSGVMGLPLYETAELLSAFRVRLL